MKRTVYPLRAGNRAGVAFVALLALGAAASALKAAPSERPRRGGTLRVQMSEHIGALDPRQWPVNPSQAAAADRVDSLVFDRLIRVDEYGTLQPALAVSWQHDAQAKRWQFRLREDVKFSDGALLTPPIAAMALQQLMGVSFDVSASSDSVVVQLDKPEPNLALQLATGRYFVYHSGEDGSLTGTGPFRLSQRQSVGNTEMSVFDANESCWAGRPFVDKLALTSGVSPDQQANAIAFGQADVVELPASEVRRAAQRGVRTLSSDPVELFALVLDASRPPMQDARVRQAVSLSIDRASIADVILQKQGIAAGSLLPNWITGYSHLFSAALDLPRAKELLASSGAVTARSAPLVLLYDSGDAEARAVADRVAVNLREVGIKVQVTGQNADGKTKPTAGDARLVRRRLAAPDPTAALSELLSSVGELPGPLETPEQLYAAECAPIEAFRVIPLVHISESFGLSPQVRDWMAPRWGGWNLADVWLGPPAGGGNSP